METMILDQKIRIKSGDSEYWYSLPLLNKMILPKFSKNTLERRDDIGETYSEGST
jgi:hypothetical protein